MRTILTFFALCAFSTAMLAQTKLPISVDAKLNLLQLDTSYVVAPKYSEDGKAGELMLPNGSKITAQIELNPLNVESILYRANASEGTAKFRLSLGTIRFQVTNPQPSQRPAIGFEIKVGEATYSCSLHRFPFSEAPLLVLQPPQGEIRIPIDRAHIAILKFEDKMFFNETGTFPLEAILTIESPNPPQRRTRRR